MFLDDLSPVSDHNITQSGFDKLNEKEEKGGKRDREKRKQRKERWAKEEGVVVE